MSTPESKRSLIDEIDDRQNDLLNQLATLNARVESLLDTCLQAREEERMDVETRDGTPIPGGPNVPISQLPEAAVAPQEC
jgi:hypothetical protein